VRPDLELILVRHGETLWNRTGRFQGHRDSPLTLAGIAQLRRLGRQLRRRFGARLHDFELVASPLPRAWQSAVLLLEQLGLAPERIRLDPEVREIGWGAWDGLTAADIEARDRERWLLCVQSGFAVAPPGGESRSAVFARARGWLARQPPQARILLVAHGTINGALCCAYLDLPDAAMLDIAIPAGGALHLRAGTLQERFPQSSSPLAPLPPTTGRG